MKSWIQVRNIEMYSRHNEGKSVVARSLQILQISLSTKFKNI